MAFFLLVGLGVLIGLGALVLNLTWLTCQQVRLRDACVAAALAGAVELLDPAASAASVVSGSTTTSASVATDAATVARIVAAQQQAATFAAYDGVLLQTTASGAVAGNVAEDVLAGWVEDPPSPDSAFAPWTGAGAVDSLLVRAVRRRSRGDAVTLWFGGFFGVADAEPAAVARASIDQRVYGFRPNGHVRVPLLPLAVLVGDRWPCGVASGEPVAQDRYEIDQRTGEVRPQADGIGEITLQINAADSASPTGGGEAESACWLSLTGSGANLALPTEQVTQGLGPADLEALGGGFVLGDDGGLLLPAMPAPNAAQLVGLQAALLAIRGQKRLWPLGVLAAAGEPRMCRVQGFAAGCVADCYQQSQSSLTVVVQPCLLQTCTALTRSGVARNRWIGKLFLNE